MAFAVRDGENVINRLQEISQWKLNWRGVTNEYYNGRNTTSPSVMRDMKGLELRREWS